MANASVSTAQPFLEKRGPVHRSFRWALYLTLLSIPAPSAARVVLVGVDGGSWNLIDPMLRSGDLPQLSALISRGVSADLETVEPVRSPVVWTSIATGRSPEAHGITDFFSTAMAIRVPTVFERLSAAGHRIGLYDYLMTWPPTSAPGGFVIPGWLRRDGSTTPENVWSRIALSPFVTSYDGAYTSAHYRHRAALELREKAKRWNALLRAFDIEIGAVIFYALDMTSHRFWQASFPEDFDGEARGYTPAEGRAIPNALRGIDHSLGEIVSALGPGDTILIASDHGFRAAEDDQRSVWVGHFEQALGEAALEPQRDGFSLLSTFGAVTLRVHPGDLAQRDATSRALLDLLDSFQSVDGSPLFSTTEAVDIAPRPDHAKRPWLERLRQWVVRQVVRHVFRVTLDGSAHAVVFGLPDDDLLESLWPDGEIRIGKRTLAVSRAFSRQRFTGDHDPVGIFLAAGGPIAHREGRGELSVLDIAPLLFYLSGEDIPDDLEGQLPTRWIDPDHLRRNPPKSAPAAEVPTLHRDAQQHPASAGDAGLTEKLRALGYIE